MTNCTSELYLPKLIIIPCWCIAAKVHSGTERPPTCWQVVSPKPLYALKPRLETMDSLSCKFMLQAFAAPCLVGLVAIMRCRFVLATGLHHSLWLRSVAHSGIIKKKRALPTCRCFRDCKVEARSGRGRILLQTRGKAWKPFPGEKHAAEIFACPLQADWVHAFGLAISYSPGYDWGTCINGSCQIACLH